LFLSSKIQLVIHISSNAYMPAWFSTPAGFCSGPLSITMTVVLSVHLVFHHAKQSAVARFTENALLQASVRFTGKVLLLLPGISYASSPKAEKGLSSKFGSENWGGLKIYCFISA
jgi:hypothetical protein